MVDLNVEALRDDDLRWADIVLTGGMPVQEQSIHEIIEARAETGDTVRLFSRAGAR
ncbi:MAG: hypothetical protein PHU25_14570 [Deltaproteobacteria bacterium]|nr:hypothetical protein [Deltaproteobacteria bacterium]